MRRVEEKQTKSLKNQQTFKTIRYASDASVSLWKVSKRLSKKKRKYKEKLMLVIVICKVNPSYTNFFLSLLFQTQLLNLPYGTK